MRLMNGQRCCFYQFCTITEVEQGPTAFRFLRGQNIFTHGDVYAQKSPTVFHPYGSDLRVIQQRLYWSFTCGCCTSIDRAAVFPAKEWWQTCQAYHRLKEPHNSRNCHHIYPMTRKSFHCPKLKPVRHFEAEFSINLKTELDINYSGPVTQHHRNKKILIRMQHSQHRKDIGQI